jgi:hypothetical protein
MSPRRAIYAALGRKWRISRCTAKAFGAQRIVKTARRIDPDDETIGAMRREHSDEDC